MTAPSSETGNGTAPTNTNNTVSPPSVDATTHAAIVPQEPTEGSENLTKTATPEGPPNESAAVNAHVDPLAPLRKGAENDGRPDARTREDKSSKRSPSQRQTAEGKAPGGVLSSIARRLSLSLVPKPNVTPHLHTANNTASNAAAEPAVALEPSAAETQQSPSEAMDHNKSAEAPVDNLGASKASSDKAKVTEAPATDNDGNAVKKLLTTPIVKRTPSALASNLRRRLSYGFPTSQGHPKASPSEDTEVADAIDAQAENNGSKDTSDAAKAHETVASSPAVVPSTDPTHSVHEAPSRDKSVHGAKPSLNGPVLVGKAEELMQNVKRRLASGPPSVAPHRKTGTETSADQLKTAATSANNAGHTPPLSPMDKIQEPGKKAVSSDYSKKATAQPSGHVAFVAGIKQAFQGQLVSNNSSSGTANKKKAEELKVAGTAEEAAAATSDATKAQEKTQPTSSSDGANVLDADSHAASHSKPLVDRLRWAATKVRSGLNEATASVGHQVQNRGKSARQPSTAAAAGAGAGAGAATHNAEPEPSDKREEADKNTAVQSNAAETAAVGDASATFATKGDKVEHGHSHGKETADSAQEGPAKDFKTDSPDSGDATTTAADGVDADAPTSCGPDVSIASATAGDASSPDVNSATAA